MWMSQWLMEHLSQAEVHRSGGDWVWTEYIHVSLLQPTRARRSRGKERGLMRAPQAKLAAAKEPAALDVRHQALKFAAQKEHPSDERSTSGGG